MRCPCHSGKPYEECCKPLHQGKAAVNALLLMRSRYAAYALGLADYIIRTTHPTNLHYSNDLATWKKDILHFSRETRFIGLTIHDWVHGEREASVTFTAHLSQKNQDVSFTEKSRFVKEAGAWYYQNPIQL